MVSMSGATVPRLLLTFALLLTPDTTRAAAGGGSEQFSLLPDAERNQQGVVQFRPSGGRNILLSSTLAGQVRQMMTAKNFSFIIDFKLDEHAQGTLLSVYADALKVFELHVEGLRGEIDVHWRRHTSLAQVTVEQSLDDGQWHRIIFDLSGSRLRLYADCRRLIDNYYPEIYFSSLTSADNPLIWVGQRRSGSRFQGGIRRFMFSYSPSFLREECRVDLKPQYASTTPQSPLSPFQTNKQPTGIWQPFSPTSGPQTSGQLEKKIFALENDLARLIAMLWPNANAGNNERNRTGQSMPEPQLPPEGKCPNCYEYMRYKINHLNDDLKRWQRTVERMELNLNQVMLFVRGCQVNKRYVQDGERWTNQTNCTECQCSLGKIVCKPVGCTKPANCSRPFRPDGECCPRCGRSCSDNGNTYEHDQQFFRNDCTRCQCVDGQLQCSYKRVVCPDLGCPLEQQFRHDNQCCAVCQNDDFCAKQPCHKDAVCTNRKYDRKCECKPGFFGDGLQCYDVDECAWDADIAEQLGGCGPGSRCINFPGSFRCQCLPGYARLDDRKCIDNIIR